MSIEDITKIDGTESVELAPSWTFAMQIYIACLQNPDADPEAHKGAKADLMALASWADKAMEKQRR